MMNNQLLRTRTSVATRPGTTRAARTATATQILTPSVPPAAARISLAAAHMPTTASVAPAVTPAAQKAAISARNVVKRYRGGNALDGFDLSVAPGVVHGLLGPNGAGKTTSVRIMSTLLSFDSGRVEVAGHDVALDPSGVRAHIGIAGQYAAIDSCLSGRANLEMFARLNHMRGALARQRAAELLERFDLVDAAGKAAGQYSGGMRRRLDLAVSLIRRPRVLFLDEPSTGLDPRSRNEVWQAVRELADGGTTVLLTTQYLEEADQLCQRISLVDAGRVVAEGTPTELKSQVGGTRVEAVVPEQIELTDAALALAGSLAAQPTVDRASRTITVPLQAPINNERQRDHASVLTQLSGALDAAGLGVGDITLTRPDLDDVFLSLTGRPTR